jgi:surface protein
MFSLNKVFNQDISFWDVSEVTDMTSMFNSAEAFNQDLSDWDIRNVLECRSFSSNALSWTLPKPNFSYYGYCP